MHSFLQTLISIPLDTVLYCLNIFTIERPEISSTNKASIFINFFYLGLTTACSFEKNDIDLFKNLNEESPISFIPSNSYVFFIPNTRCTLSCISDTNVNKVCIFSIIEPKIFSITSFCLVSTKASSGVLENVSLERYIKMFWKTFFFIIC